MTLGTIAPGRGMGDTSNPPSLITITNTTPLATPTPQYNPQTGQYDSTVSQMLDNMPLNSPGSAALTTQVLNEELTAGACTNFFDQYFNPSCGTPYGLYALVALGASLLFAGVRRR